MYRFQVKKDKFNVYIESAQSPFEDFSKKFLIQKKKKVIKIQKSISFKMFEISQMIILSKIEFVKTGNPIV